MKSPSFGNWSGVEGDVVPGKISGRGHKIAAYLKPKKAKYNGRVDRKKNSQAPQRENAAAKPNFRIVTRWEPGKDYYIFYNGGAVFGDADTIKDFCAENSISPERIKRIT